jgi:hypothetical protein
MPFHIIKFKTGFKVQNKDTNKTYSKKPLAITAAKKQLVALHIHTKK